MTVALVFAGQGVEPPWLGPELVTRAAARPLVEAASDHTGHDVATLLVRGGTALARVEVLQPAFVAASLVVAAALADAGLVAKAVCGHSLGELAAWSAGGYVSATAAIAAAAVRGRLMAREAARHPGGMVVVAPADLPRARELGLVIAGENTPEETALAGDDRAIAASIAHAHARRLDVAGAWHSPAMADAVNELRAALAAVPQTHAGIPFVCNRDGSVARGDLPSLLAEQLVRPVKWIAVARTLVELGATRFVIAGAGKAVRASLRANVPGADIRMVVGERDLARAVAP